MITATTAPLAVSDWKDFAQSPAGWITGILVPVLLALFLRKASRDAAFRTQMWIEVRALTAAQAEQTRALSVLVSNVEHTTNDAARVPELSSEVAVLRDRLDRHESWSAEQRREVLEAVRATQSPGGGS